MIEKQMSNTPGDGAAPTAPDLPTVVSVDDMRTFSTVAADLADAAVMGEAWHPISALRGKYAGRGPRVDDARRSSRREDDETDSRQRGPRR